MSALGSDFTDNTIFIYDTSGIHLKDTSVTSHDRRTQHIQVGAMPAELKINDNCKLLIMSSPAPCEFLGKVKREGGNLYIAMFQGQEKESRGATRYPVTTPAMIDSFIVDNQEHPLQNPIHVVLINISTTGVRFRAPYYSFEEGDVFRMHLVISNNKRRITAEVNNYVDEELKHSDYGCRFLMIE